MRIHSFGYESPKKAEGFPSDRRGSLTTTTSLSCSATEYADSVLKDVPGIAIVSHSQGGLILQRFLEWMLNQGKGRDLSRDPDDSDARLPKRRVRVPGIGPSWPEARPSLLRFGSLDVLDRRIADTQRRVLGDTAVPADGIGDHQCRIPFHVYAGSSSDNIVKPASAQGAFPGASTLAVKTTSPILNPAAPSNRTAESVKHHILTDLAASSVEGREGAAPAVSAPTEASTPGRQNRNPEVRGEHRRRDSRV